MKNYKIENKIWMKNETWMRNEFPNEEMRNKKVKKLTSEIWKMAHKKISE